MTKKTRYFMAGSAAVLAAGLCTGLVAYYGGGFQALSASTGPIELRYVPPTPRSSPTPTSAPSWTPSSGSASRKRCRCSRRGRKSSSAKPASTSSATSTTSSPAVTPGTHSALVVARGRFNPTHLENLAVSTAAWSRLQGQAAGFEDRRPPATASKGGTLAFLEPGLVAIGDTATVKRAIDAQLTAHEHHQQQRDDELVSDIEAGNNAWAVGRFDVLTAHAKLPEQIARQIPPVKWFAAAGHINGGVSGMVRAEANDDQAAELFRRQVNGALAFGEMVGRSDPRASAVLKTVQMSGTGKTVQLSFTLPGELLQLVLPKAPAVAIEAQ